MGHIPGQDNVQADKESRVFNLNMEWCLSNLIFKLGCQKLAFTHNIDLFASRINHQLKAWGYGNTELANPSVVDKSQGYASPTASFTTKKQTHTVSTQSSRTNPSSAQKTLPHAVLLVGQQLKEQSFSTTAARVIQSS